MAWTARTRSASSPGACPTACDAVTGGWLLPALLCLLAVAGEAAWLGGVWWFLRPPRPASGRAEGRVTLLLAATGRSAGLPALFGSLARQTLTPRRMILAVEGDDDPVVAQARELAAVLPFPVEVAVAGADAERRSQKATNLIAGLRLVDEADEAVGLPDAGIPPREGWLMGLATPALRGALPRIFTRDNADQKRLGELLDLFNTARFSRLGEGRAREGDEARQHGEARAECGAHGARQRNAPCARAHPRCGRFSCRSGNAPGSGR